MPSVCHWWTSPAQCARLIGQYGVGGRNLMRHIGRVASVVFGAVMLLGAALSPATAKDWFDFDREEALQRVRAAVERLEALAPIPPLRCRPRAMTLRYCLTEIVAGLEFEIVKTVDVDPFRAVPADYERFRDDENAGKVYEIEVRIRATSDRASSAATLFANLCPAIILAVRPSIGPRGAMRRFETQLRRSLNRSASGDGEIRLIGNPDTLFIDSWRDGSAYCKVTAEDDYRLQEQEEAAERAAARRRR